VGAQHRLPGRGCRQPDAHLIAIGAAQVAGPREALAELGHLDADPARVAMVDVDGLSFRGVFHLVAGDLGQAVSDMTASLKMARRGANMTLGLRTYLRRAHTLFLALRAAPFIARTEQELAACHLPADPAKKQPVLALTSRETEVAHLVGKGLSNPEVAAELFISRRAVEYHLGNIYAKCGLKGRQQLRHFVQQWRQPAVV
jgi:DNA-binding NarL/FixJ family response regulator